MTHKLIPFYYTLALCFAVPNLSLIFLRGILETTSKLTYLGNKLNCFYMTCCEITELSLICVTHFWLTSLFRKIKKIPLVILNVLFISLYCHLTFLNLGDFNAGLMGMQFTTPSAYLVWFLKFGSKIDHFSTPINVIPSVLKIDMNIQLALEIMKVQINYYIPLFIGSFVFICISLYILNLYKEEILMSTFIGKYALPFFGRNNNKNVKPRAERVHTSTTEEDRKMENGAQREEVEENRTNNSEREMKVEIKKSDKENEDSKFKGRIVINIKKLKENKVIIGLHFMSILYIFVLIYVIICENNLKSVFLSRLSNTQSAILSLTRYEKHISPELSENLVDNVREYLPPGRRWLDTREKPVFPAVHSDIETFCAYNNNHPDCINYKPQPHVPLVKQLPNVLFIVYESFTPGPYLIDDEFIIEHASKEQNDSLRYITDTKYYNSWIMKHFNKIQDYGVTFSGMSSLGIPTASGFHSLMTGMYPSQSFYNILDGSLLHSDDFPSMMKSYGYRNFWITAAGFAFDSINLIVYRKPAREEAMNRLKCKEAFGDLIDDELQQKLVGEKSLSQLKTCDPNEVNKLEAKLKKRRLDFPRWFDYAFHYPLTKSNAQYLNLDPNSARKKTKWAADRVSTAQVITHWKQQKEFMKKHNISMPIFGGVTTTDSHFEFFGQDKQEFYDYNIKENMKKNNDDWNRERFIRVNKYADKYVGGLLEWIKENDPNTIFVITGDHAVRKVPTFEPDDTVINDVVYSSDCVHHSSGSDAFFVTSGMIGYFGDDPKVKEVMHLDKIKGKTLKLPTDHNDLVYTIEDILTKLNGTSMQPTHRRNRNLLDLTNNLVDHVNNGTFEEYLHNIDETNWKSFSFNHYNIDYREGTNLYRVHQADIDGGHFYKRASYPQCLRKRDRYPHLLGTEEGNEAYERMGKTIASENYLTVNNRLYNYEFRNRTCVEKGHCEFPDSAGESYYYDLSSPFILITSVLKYSIGIWLVLELVSYIILFIVRKKNKNYNVL